VNFEFLAAARVELEEAYDWYEVQREGLGQEFAREVYRTIQRILDHPLAWTKLSRRTRRCRTERFNYGIIYQVKRDHILIVAVMHLSRKPGYWKSRL
jgi:plasmid stabilization system protein ParE